MPYNPTRHDRRSIRLKGYDYTSPGAYFLTLCTHQRQCLFGGIVDGVMHLNAWGQIVERDWLAIPNHNSHVELDEFVVMPNHFHGILIIGCRGEAFASRSWMFPEDFGANASPLRMDGMDGSEPGRGDGRPNGTQPGSIGAIVQTFKSQTTRKINRINQSKGRTLWQRNYYGHIVRNENALHRIRTYIQMNPYSSLMEMESLILICKHYWGLIGKAASW